MKHAGPAALDRLEPLLNDLRALGGLKEKARGVFYRRSRAFLHFHEDRSGLYADVRNDLGEFERYRIQEAAERDLFLDEVRWLLA